jgi:hypothetical protein
MVTATMVTAAAATAMAAAMTTTSRDREVSDHQRRCEKNRGNSHCDLRHGTSPHRFTSHCRYAASVAACG